MWVRTEWMVNICGGNDHRNFYHIELNIRLVLCIAAAENFSIVCSEQFSDPPLSFSVQPMLHKSLLSALRSAARGSQQLLSCGF